MDVERIREEYQTLAPRVQRFSTALLDEFSQLLKTQNIALAVPIEHRVKAWDSIANKIERKSLALEKLTDLRDLVGLRLILLFRRDLEKVHNLISENLIVHSHEDTAERLDVAQFGYQSFHYIIELPDTWLKVPTFQDFSGLKAEIQTRTLAQHMWAAASHKLQYKQEQSVPVPVRRSINRVSALLETVDLEFERVLSDREKYLVELDPKENQSKLNVDLIAQVLDELLPAQNKISDEDYADLLEDLMHFGVTTSGQLRKVIKKHKTTIEMKEASVVQDRKNTGFYAGTTKKRTDRGVFYTHVGLARSAMMEEFGRQWKKWQEDKAIKRQPAEK